MNSLDDENLLASVPERRRAIFERVKARMSARGSTIDDDPRFLELVEDWIEGKIEMGAVSRGYAAIRQSDRKPLALFQTEADPARPILQAQLLDELQKVIGMYEPETTSDSTN